jgi:hypothetical protein
MLSEMKMDCATLVECPVCAMPVGKVCISKTGRSRRHGPHRDRALNAIPEAVKYLENIIGGQQEIVRTAQSELEKIDAEILSLSETT